MSEQSSMVPSELARAAGGIQRILNFIIPFFYIAAVAPTQLSAVNNPDSLICRY